MKPYYQNKWDGYEYFVFVQDREAEQWACTGTTTYITRGGTLKRPKHETTRPSTIYPKPEAINCFIKTHKIIKAKTKEEAWQILNSK